MDGRIKKDACTVNTLSIESRAIHQDIRRSIPIHVDSGERSIPSESKVGSIDNPLAHRDAFPAGMVFCAWHANFPKAKKNLHKMIEPYAVEMVLEESDKLIGDKELQVNMKDLTLRSIQSLLQPEVIVKKYRLLAPFTWTLLETISASPNKHRK